MVYDKTGGQYDAPMHHRLQQQEQEAAVAAAKLAPGSTTVVTAKCVESGGEEDETEMGRTVRELQARLLRMEAEVAALRSQVRTQQGSGEGIAIAATSVAANAAASDVQRLLQPTVAGPSQEQ